MDEEKLIRINSFLKANNLSIDTLSKSRLTQLEKIDDAIQNKLTSRNKAKILLKNSGINISVISEDTNISRKTFYNNELLKAYVESYATNDEKNCNNDELENLKTKNEELLAQVNNFVLRDIETETLRHEIKELYKEIQNLQSRNDSLEYKYEEVQAELSEAKRLLASKNIVVFNPK